MSFDTSDNAVGKPIHAVSHFKHTETFTPLNYVQDFGTIVKKSLKTHDKSYYTVPDTSMPLSELSIMALPAVQTMSKLTKEDEVGMKYWMENLSGGSRGRVRGVRTPPFRSYNFETEILTSTESYITF